MLKRKFLQCTSLVNPSAVTRTTIDGVEHIIVSSFTLPENVVMNGIMYPANEINESFDGLNRTLAPVEHPVNANGQFVSANDPEAIHNFHAGAFNDNAIKVGNRIKLDKVINVQEALKTERGRRLLDRIDEVENSENPRPIHTSTGIFLEIEELAEPQTNQDGAEFTMIAHNMVFDHDAILLDSVGAAQPSQGVGMAVNSAGEKIDVITVNLDAKDSRVNQEGLSHVNLIEQLTADIEATVTVGWFYIADVFDDVIIIDSDKGFFEAPYRVDGDKARLTGMPIRVERIVSYEPKTNSDKKVNAMEKKIIAALNAVGIDTKGMDEDALLAAYNTLLTKANTGDDDDDAAAKAAAAANAAKPEGDDDAAAKAAAAKPEADDTVANSIKSLKDQVDGLKTQLSANDDAAKADAIKVIVASTKYPDLGEEDLKLLSNDKLQNMAANCGAGHGIPLNTNIDANGKNTAPAEMPE